MGTPEFAVPALRRIHEQFGVSAVVTVPDKPKGRGLKLQESPVAQAAEDLHIPLILKPTSLKSDAFVKQIKDINPDIICVIAFRILPETIYSLAHLGAFNVHASLLPKYRGAAPINRAIMAGERETGVTSFLLNSTVDTGSIILQRKVNISEQMTAGELYELLIPLAAECAVETCAILRGGSLAPLQQNEQLASSAPKVYRETSKIDWNLSARDVRNFIHGLSPTPCAWTTWDSHILKIYRASVHSQEDILINKHDTDSSQRRADPGMFRIVEQHFLVDCGDGWLSLDEIQLPGKRRMKDSEFISGYRGPTEGRFE